MKDLKICQTPARQHTLLVMPSLMSSGGMWVTCTNEVEFTGAVSHADGVSEFMRRHHLQRRHHLHKQLATRTVRVGGPDHW